MPQIVILTHREPDFKEFSQYLAEVSTWPVVCSSSVKEVDLTFGKAPDLLIVDETVGGVGALAVAREIIEINAMINMAVVSELSEEDFHEASEGLGIMARIPTHPGTEDAQRLFDLLRQMPGYK